MSIGRPDGTYLAGRWLEPMDPRERAELVHLSFSRHLAPERYEGLVRRRSRESVVVRWKIVGGVAQEATHIRNRLIGYGELGPERAFLWGPGCAKDHDRHLLVHALLAEVTSDTNAYLDVMQPVVDRLPAEHDIEWVLAVADITRMVARVDLVRVARRARDAGVNIGEALTLAGLLHGPQEAR